MNNNEFEVLRYICEHDGETTQRVIAEATGLSLGTVNKTVAKLRQAGDIIQDYRATAVGLEKMARYKVHNAIILAAGMSTRFVPFSYEKPKGLTVVKGEVMVERQIRQLREAGIEEIVLVLGHMMEKFLYLVDKYGVKVVINKEYRHKNTHSSIYFARAYLKNSYICCADNYFPQSVFHTYECHSLYSTLFMEGVWQGERGVITDRKGLIVDTQRPAVDQWVMNGYAYFDREFSEKFRPILEDMYDTPGTDGLYWEQVYAQHVDELPLYEKRFTADQVMEFDSVAELEAFDPDYIKYNSIAMTDNICATLGCTPAEIHEIRPIQKGYTNRSFSFLCKGKKYVYRNPGTVSSEWLDRKSEKRALEIVKQLGIDNSYIYEDEQTGWKISHFVDVEAAFDFANPVHVEMLCEKLRVLFRNPLSCGREMDYLQEAVKLLRSIKHTDEDTYRVAMGYYADIEAIDRAVKADGWPIQLVHNDLYEDNLLVSGDELYVIDWEYAGDTDIGYDICKLFVKTDAEGAQIDRCLTAFFGRAPTDRERRHIVGCAAVAFYYWYIWSLYMVLRGKDFSNLTLKYFEVFKRYQKEFYA